MIRAAQQAFGRSRRPGGNLLIFGRRHLERVLIEFIEHYHEARSHHGLGQRRAHEPANVIPLRAGPVEPNDRLGGLLHEYYRAV